MYDGIIRETREDDIKIIPILYFVGILDDRERCLNFLFTAGIDQSILIRSIIDASTSTQGTIDSSISRMPFLFLSTSISVCIYRVERAAIKGREDDAPAGYAIEAIN